MILCAGALRYVRATTGTGLKLFKSPWVITGKTAELRCGKHLYHCVFCNTCYEVLKKLLMNSESLNTFMISPKDRSRLNLQKEFLTDALTTAYRKGSI